MKKITLYSTTYCPYCFRAKELLKNLALEYTEIDVTNDSELRDRLTEKYTWYTVPMILIGDEFIGGYDELSKLHQENKLLTKLTS
jgi:glutaredoxin